MKHRQMIFACVGLLILVFSTGCSPKTSDIVDRSCGSCHDASVVYEKKRTQDEWQRIMFAMKTRGLVISSGDERSVMEFLSRSYTVKK